jgi:hypothetical protein
VDSAVSALEVFGSDLSGLDGTGLDGIGLDGIQLDMGGYSACDMIRVSG